MDHSWLIKYEVDVLQGNNRVKDVDIYGMEYHRFKDFAVKLYIHLGFKILNYSQFGENIAKKFALFLISNSITATKQPTKHLNYIL